MFENKMPHAIDGFLHSLYLIRDALRRKSYAEAHAHIGDSLASVQNEIDWCYRTDPVLTFMRDFLLQLQRTVGTIENVALSHVNLVLKDTAAVITDTLEELSGMTGNMPRWPAPNGSIDMLERKHRAYTYGYNEAEKSDSKNS